jgi:hypothetical protein
VAVSDRLKLVQSYFEHDLALVERVEHPVFQSRGLELFVQREDKLGSGLLSGNKFRKLKYNLLEAAVRSLLEPHLCPRRCGPALWNQDDRGHSWRGVPATQSGARICKRGGHGTPLHGSGDVSKKSGS